FRLAADFRAVHRQRRQVAFLVRTLSGKPDPQGFRIRRHADPNQEPCEKQSRAGTEEERRLIPRGSSPQSKGRPTLVISTIASLKAYSASVFSLTLISHEEACTYAKVQLALRTFSACHRPCSGAGLSQVGDFRRLFLSSFGRRELQWRQRLYLLQPQQLARRPGRHWRLPQWSGGVDEHCHLSLRSQAKLSQELESHALRPACLGGRSCERQCLRLQRFGQRLRHVHGRRTGGRDLSSLCVSLDPSRVHAYEELGRDREQRADLRRPCVPLARKVAKQCERSEPTSIPQFLPIMA